MSSDSSNTRRVEGRVVSTGAQKTISVLVTSRVKHKIGKYITRTKKYMAHDEAEKATVGARVLIEECRPVSKRKSWTLVDVLETSQA